MEEVVKGVVMEIEDTASPFIHQLVATTDPMVAFKDCDIAILVGAMPRTTGMERKDLLKANAIIFKHQGQALNAVARTTCKVLVVGNPANTNAYIVAHYATSIPRENFSALTRLDHNRAQSLLAAKLEVSVESVSNVIIWGNHSTTQYPDVSHVRVNGKPVDILARLGPSYIHGEFMATIQKRGSQIIATRKLSSAMSAAKAVVDQLRAWFFGTPPGQFVSMAVSSDGSYGSPPGIFFSLPVRCDHNGNWKIAEKLSIDEFSAAMIVTTSMELLEEKAEALACLQNSPNLTFE